MKDLFLCFLAAFFVKEYASDIQLVILLIFTCVLIKRKNRISIVVLIVLTARFHLMPQMMISNEIEGRVVKVNEASFQIQTNSGTVQIISDQLPVIDTVVLCTGELKPNDSSFHFFEIESVVDAVMFAESVDTLKEGTTIRSMIHRRILAHPDHITQKLMMKTLLRCSNEDTQIISSLYFSFMIMIIRRFLRIFLDEHQSEFLELGCILFLSMLWSCEMTGIRFLYFRYAKKLKLTFYESLGLFCVCMSLLWPHEVSSSSFWFAVVIRLALQSLQFRKTGLFWILMLGQLCFYGTCDAVNLMMNPFKQMLSCISFFLSLFALLVPVRLNGWIEMMKWIEDILPSFELHGTISLIHLFVLIYVLSIISQKYQLVLMTGSVLLCSINLMPRILFINVGQGDSALIQLPFQKINVLIDTGPASSYYQLKNTLHAHSVYEIDLLILSHQDADHSANKESLMEDFDVRQVWDNTQNKSEYDPLHILQLNEYDVQDEENDKSLILTFHLNGLNLMFSGDASYDKEEAAIYKVKETMDVCKIGHHGSKTSTSMKYLDKAGCRIAIISAGVNNAYRHPHTDVLQRLTINGSTVLNTQVHGDIQFVMTRFFNLVTTSNHEFAIIMKN